jgi:hypothetical protein
LSINYGLKALIIPILSIISSTFLIIDGYKKYID